MLCTGQLQSELLLMKAHVEVVYFMGCPNAAAVFEVLKKHGISFGFVIQDRLPSGDPKRTLS